MSVSFVLAELDAELAALRALPDALAGEAEHIVEGASNATVAAIRRRYPFVSGNLIKGVSATVTRTGVSTKARVRSGAPHARLYEYGFAGTKRRTPPHVFGQELARSRREVAAKLRALMERHGLRVTETA